jgi:hypothetical protein
MKFQLDIDGQTVELHEGDLAITNVTEDAPKAAAMIFYWGSVAAAIRQQLEKARHDYRHLRGRTLAETLASEPKLSEWKIMAAFEASEGFRRAKSAIEHWQRFYDQAQAIYTATQARASVIQTIYKHESGGKAYAGSIGNDAKQTKTDKVRDLLRKKQ